MSEMGKRIHNLRIEKGYSLEQLGEKIGVGKSTVRKWETGAIENMRRDKIISVAKALGVDPEYLIGWNKDETISEIKKDDPNSVLIKSIKEKIEKMNGDQLEQLLKYARFIESEGE